MLLGVRFAADAAILLIALALQPIVVGRLFAPEGRANLFYKTAIATSSSLLYVGLAVSLGLIWRNSHSGIKSWLGGIALGWSFALFGAAIIAAFVRPVAGVQHHRRRFLTLAGKAAVAAPIAGVAYGMIAGRNRFSLQEIPIFVPGLPKDLDGIKIVQLTDIHLGIFLEEAEFARAIDMANETKPHLAVVTGDLISSPGDPIDEAIRQVARLKADAGILGCHGNHEVYAGVVDYTTRECERRGIRILRMKNERLQFGSAYLNLVGVDYQPMRSPYLKGVEQLVRPGDVNLLLSHNPDVFPVAADQGFALTLAGHTHGGQINFEILDRNVNAARFVTPYTKGLYRQGSSVTYVSSGIGTVGVPMRFGANPEVSLIRLCAV